MTDAILRVDNLVKRFGGIVATDGLSLEIERGEIHALIGPNGAGKTTLVSQLSGMMEADAGTIRADFAAGRIVEVRGWQLARTEVELCAAAVRLA